MLGVSTLHLALPVRICLANYRFRHSQKCSTLQILIVMSMHNCDFGLTPEDIERRRITGGCHGNDAVTCFPFYLTKSRVANVPTSRYEVLAIFPNLLKQEMFVGLG